MVDQTRWQAAGVDRWPRSSCSSRWIPACCASANSRPRPAACRPYFFNAGLFDDGAKLGPAGAILCTAHRWPRGIEFDMLFGPAYKGIPLAAAVAMELARLGRNVPFAYNRKEAKDHGEGGTLVGAPVRGPGADRRRRDVGRHRGARIDRDHPGRRRHAARRGHRAGPPGEGHRERRGRGRTAPCSMSATSSACRFARLRRLADLLQYLAANQRGARLGAHHAQVLAYRAAVRRGLRNVVQPCGMRAAWQPLLALGGLRQRGLARRAQGIYTCVDAKGRRLTSDRPIMECIDREQNELSAGGTVRAQDRPLADGRRTGGRGREGQRAGRSTSRASTRKSGATARCSTRYPDAGACTTRSAPSALAPVDDVIAAAQQARRRTGRRSATRWTPSSSSTRTTRARCRPS